MEHHGTMTRPQDEPLEIEILDPGTPVDAREGFSALYEREFLAMVRLATLLTGRPETARDVVQDAFVKLHVAWPRVREPGAYLRRSVVNGCRSVGRWESRRRGRTLRDEPAVADEVRELDDALLSLPHRQRAALVLRFYEGRTEHEIADLLGCRPGSVGPLIHRGLARLREVVEP